MHKRFVAMAVMAVVVAGLSFLSPPAAQAGARASYSIDYCSSGSYEGAGTNDLSNGTLRMGWCNGSGEIRTVTVRYDKVYGSSVTVKLGWRTTNSNASEVGPIHWDSSSSDWGTISAGQSWSWRQSPNLDIPSARPCVQGVMSDGDRNYYTHNSCS